MRTKLAFVILAVAAVVGVWALTNRSEEAIKNQINSTVTRLCMANRPVLEKENNLRDVQIEIAEDAKIINLAQGEVARAQLNERTIVALSAAKRKVPTEEECNRDLIP